MQSSDALLTPEAVALERPLAGVGSRGLAYLLDLAIVGLSALLIVLSATAAVSAAALDLPTWVAVVLGLLLVFGVQFGYPITLETRWRGRTLGKAAMGLRVVTVDGAPVGFRHAAVRAALGVVDFHLTLGAAAVLTALISRRSQRLGDLVAGTVVIRERHAAGEAQAADFQPPPELVAYAQQLDVARVDPRTYQAVRTLLQRGDALDEQARSRLTRQLADRTRALVAPPPPTGTPDLALLRAVAAAVQRRGTLEPGGGAERPPTSSPPPPSPSTAQQPSPQRPPTPEASPPRDDGGFAPPG